jgi:hypothetical protein
MTTKKKTTTTKAACGPAASTATTPTEHDIYTAHQVHTLVHLTFQQLATSRMLSAASPPFGGWAGQPPMMQGCAPHPSQVLLYWYP